LEERTLPSIGFGPLPVPDILDTNALQGLTGNTRYVELLYLDILGRTGSIQEMQPWVRVLNNGASPASVASGIDLSSEARTHLVKSWYLQYLGRQALQGEEQSWVSALLGGAPEDQALSGILSSAEFLNHAQTLVSTGPANQRFVGALYLQFLGRAGSNAELTSWAAALDTLGRGGVARAIIDSTEARTNVIDAIYSTLLRRPPDSAGLHGWLISNLDLRGIRESVEGSPEFFSNGQPPSGGTLPGVAPNGPNPGVQADDDHLKSIWDAQKQREDAQQQLQDHLNSIWEAQQQREDYLNSLWQNG
jgi:hypothetical protein